MSVSRAALGLITVSRPGNQIDTTSPPPSRGSSRIFPAKNAISTARRLNYPLALHTDAGRQAQEYDLSNWAVFAAANSGKTSEVIKLFTDLKARRHKHLYGLTAGQNSRLEALSTKSYVLSCGGEGAVAATKSVIEQALFYQAMLEHACGIPLLDQSAIEAVKQWVYTPTLLNGVPVPVIMTVTVNFKLS